MSMILLVGAAAGIASAMLTLSLATGSLLAILLFLFAPLPIMIVALGWHQAAGMIGAVVGSTLLLFLFGGDSARAYALSVGLPAWWLAYLALLAQPAPDNPDELQWYPTGRIVVWAAVIGTALVLITIPVLASSLEEYRAALRTTFEAFLREETGTAAGAPIELPGDGDADRLINFVVTILPALGAATWTTVTMLNIWLAGRVVRASNRLRRPWPDVSAFRLPRYTPAVFMAAMVGTLLSGFPGFAAEILTATMTVVFAALGLALIHAGTRGTRGRTTMLIVTYFLIAVQTWTVLVLAVVGLAEHTFELRARIAARTANGRNGAGR